MNKYIKLLVEGIFDDDLFDTNDDVDMSNSIISLELHKLSKREYNKTEYPKDLTNFDLDSAKSLADLGDAVVKSLFGYLYISKTSKLRYICNFNTNSVIVTIYNSDNESAHLDLLELILKSNMHISTIYYKLPYNLLIKETQYGYDFNIILINDLLSLDYKIDEVLFNLDIFRIHSKCKEINLSNGTEGNPITNKTINNMPVFKISDPNSSKKVGLFDIAPFKNISLNLVYETIFDKLETVWSYLDYWRSTYHIKKMKIETYCRFVSDKPTFEETQELFTKFARLYNITLYSFTLKDRIINILEDAAKLYASEVYKDYSLPALIWYRATLYDKGKDEDGSFLMVLIEYEYDNIHKKHVWHSNYYKFYKTGYYKLYKTEKDIRF